MLELQSMSKYALLGCLFMNAAVNQQISRINNVLYFIH